MNAWIEFRWSNPLRSTIDVTNRLPGTVARSRLYCLTKQSLRFVVGMLSITWIIIILSSCIKRVSHGGTVRNSIPFENVSKPIPVVLVTLRYAEGAHVWWRYLKLQWRWNLTGEVIMKRPQLSESKCLRKHEKIPTGTETLWFSHLSLNSVDDSRSWSVTVESTM